MKPGEYWLIYDCGDVINFFIHISVYGDGSIKVPLHHTTYSSFEILKNSDEWKNKEIVGVQGPIKFPVFEKPKKEFPRGYSLNTTKEILVDAQISLKKGNVEGNAELIEQIGFVIEDIEIEIEKREFKEEQLYILQGFK